MSQSEHIRFQVLRVLHKNPGASQRQIASESGVSLGAVNYCLRALADKGFVKISNFCASDKKLRYAYVLTPSGLQEKVQLTGRFLKRKKAEYEALRAEIEALQQEDGAYRDARGE